MRTLIPTAASRQFYMRIAKGLTGEKLFRVVSATDLIRTQYPTSQPHLELAQGDRLDLRVALPISLSEGADGLEGIVIVHKGT